MNEIKDMLKPSRFLGFLNGETIIRGFDVFREDGLTITMDLFETAPYPKERKEIEFMLHHTIRPEVMESLYIDLDSMRWGIAGP